MATPQPMSARAGAFLLFGVVALVVAFQFTDLRPSDDSEASEDGLSTLPIPIDTESVGAERQVPAADTSDEPNAAPASAPTTDPYGPGSGIGTGIERVVPPIDEPLDSINPSVGAGTSPTATQSTCCTTGQARVRAYTTPSFDSFTRQLDASGAAALASLYTGGVVVFSPYWDSKLDVFSDATAYIDLYAIYPQRLAANDDVVLRDTNGNRLYIPWGCGGGTCPQYAADLGNPIFRERLSARIGELHAAGYRRVLLDDVNMHMSVGNGNGVSVAPVDPRTGQEMTLTDWRRNVAETVEFLAAEWPDVSFEHNGVWFVDSPTFDDPFIDRQIAAADVIHLERGGSDGGLTGGTDRFSLENLMRFAERAQRLGTDVFYYHQSPDTAVAHELNLAVYLLTNTGRDYVGSNDVTHVGLTTFWGGYQMDLGAATGSRTADNGLHERHFTDGVVYVLEPGATSRTITLDRPRFTTSGELVSSINLTGGSGRVLTDTCDTGCS